MKVIVVLVLVLIALPGKTAFSQAAQRNRSRVPVKTESKVRFTTGTSALNIPFELWSNLILLQVEINRSKPLRFILDTGADTSVIDMQRAKELRLKPQGKIVASGGAGQAQATFTRGVSVDLQGVQLLDRTIYALPLGSLSLLGRTIDGVIGNDILGEFAIEINYSNRTINLYEPKSYRYTGKGEIVLLTMDDGLPFVRASVTPEGRTSIEGRFEIDSGSTSAFLLNTPFVKKNDLLSSSPKTARMNIGGVGGTAETLVGRIKNAKLGTFVIDHPIVRFSQAKRGDYASSKYDGLIGGEVLRRFKVVIDYGRRQMMLEPNGEFAETFEIDMSGIALVADNNELLIDEVDTQSPAAEAGIIGSDILLAIDGRPATDIGLDQIRTMFMQAGKEYSLSVRRNGKVLNFTIKLRRLI